MQSVVEPAVRTALDNVVRSGNSEVEWDSPTLAANRDCMSDEMLLLDDGQGGNIFLVHFFWTVAICSLDRDLQVRDVRSVQAKCGFSVSWDSAPIVTFHAHPGTGMFYDTRKRVTVQAGKVVLEDAP